MKILEIERKKTLKPSPSEAHRILQAGIKLLIQADWDQASTNLLNNKVGGEITYQSLTSEALDLAYKRLELVQLGDTPTWDKTVDIFASAGAVINHLESFGLTYDGRLPS